MKAFYFIYLFILALPSISFSQVITDSKNAYAQAEIPSIGNNPTTLMEIEITDEMRKVISGKPNNVVLPLQYFIKGTYYYQTDNEELSTYWFDKLIALRTDSICVQINAISNKQACGDFTARIKSIIIKHRIYKLFGEQKRDEYCENYRILKENIPAELVLFESSFKEMSTCGTSFENPIFWDYPYEQLIYRFMWYDCKEGIHNPVTNLQIFKKAITNYVWELPENDTIQKLVAQRLIDYLEETDQWEEAKNELDAVLEDFEQHAKLIKSVWYYYENEFVGIPIVLYSTTLKKENWTKEQIKRHNNGNPIKTKEEIIQEFKRTSVYKIIQEGRQK